MIGRRYQLLNKLGSGGMGAVYRALDRLTGLSVALKQVTAPEIEMGDGSHHFSAQTLQLTHGSKERMLLAREFRLLASLRHPNIISVLDYGFDEDQRPYYSMEVVEHPRTLLEAGRLLPKPERVGLLIQALQALAYLHRRGVIHRDVKPSNVMVDDGRVKLVDFGISEARGAGVRSDATTSPAGVTGTVPYLAPELLHGQPGNEAADLWAVGVMAYELFAGRHPHESKTLPAMMMKIVGELPELSTADFDARMIPVLERLLAKDPQERYHDANEVIDELASAAKIEQPKESAAIRDSFLQAARLVGRRDELAELSERLQRAMEGRGSVLLVGGESGVGKSRLLDELRTLSLVQGSLVLTGQSVGQSASPYQVWRQPLRWLCLLADISDEDAAVLKDQVPDIANLLDREIPDAPVVDPQTAQQRLLAVISGLFASLEQPLTVVLEDLHWAGNESLAVLGRLRESIEGLPLFIVGSYRDDERPDLPSELPGVDNLKLSRLAAKSIAELSESMLGQVGRRKEILALLQRETEGNAFFLVEVVRALAEEAGRLDSVDVSRLPEHISTGGIQKIIQRRLHRVPREARPMLRTAAVIGREIDVEVLRALEPHESLGRWLATCADVAVLEVQGEQWRFAHDRLREVLLHELAPAQRRKLHRGVATAIEEVYAEAPEHIAALAHHWGGAADFSDEEATAKAVLYKEKAGRQALASCATQRAETLLKEGLELLETLMITPERQRQEVRLRIELGGTYLMSKGHAAAEVGMAFGRARALAQQIGDEESLRRILLGLWRHHVVRGELATSRELAELLLEKVNESRHTSFLVLAEYALGTNHLFQGEPGPAWDHFRKSIETAAMLSAEENEEIGLSVLSLGQHPVVAALEYGAWALWLLGSPSEAKRREEEGLALADELAHPFSQAFARFLATWLAQLRHDVEGTAAAARRAVDLSSRQGFAYFLAMGTMLGGWAQALSGDPEGGVARIQGMLDRLRAVGSELCRPYFLSMLAEAHGAAGQPEDGLYALDEALDVVERNGEGWWESEIYRLRGELALRLPTPDSGEAESCFLKALHCARLRGAVASELRAALAVYRLWWGEGEERQTKARQTLQVVLEKYGEGSDIAEVQEARRLLESKI